MPLLVAIPPSKEPVDLSMLKKHLRLAVSNPEEYTIEDDTLDMMTSAATGAFQDRLKVQLITATLVWESSGFSRKMELPRPPLQSVEEVAYFDADGEKRIVHEEDYRV